MDVFSLLKKDCPPESCLARRTSWLYMLASNLHSFPGQSGIPSLLEPGWTERRRPAALGCGRDRLRRHCCPGARTGRSCLSGYPSSIDDGGCLARMLRIGKRDGKRDGKRGTDSAHRRCSKWILRVDPLVLSWSPLSPSVCNHTRPLTRLARETEAASHMRRRKCLITESLSLSCRLKTTASPQASDNIRTQP